MLRNGKQLSLQQLERDYQDWILQMHSMYDEEFSCGDDEPIVLIAVNKEELGITADVVRVHQVITRKGQSWNKGQKIKILKGACPGCHKSNIYATIEYFLLENLRGDAGGEARLICRPQEVQIHDGAKLTNESLELHSSISVPITVIDSGKCLALTNDEWNFQVEKLNLKLPSSIEILGPKQCKALDIDRALPSGSLISAGLVPPKEVVAVLRPANFSPSSGAHNLDQKYIIKENHEMHMEVTFRPESTESPKADHNFSASATNTSRRGCQGLYIFPLRPTLFQKAGLYSFSFSLKNSASTWCEISVQVKASSEIESWELVKDDDNIPFDVSVGSCFPPFSVSRYDKYNNCVAFDSIPDILFTLMSDRVVLSRVKSAKVEMSSDQLHITVRNLRVMTGNLDTIRPLYAASLVLSQPDKSTILSIPCRVIPGAPKSVTVHLPKSTIRLHPRQVVEDVKLEIFDRYNNHVKEGLEIELQVHGFRFQDQSGKACKVDNQGFVDLSGVLKVSEGYSKPVSLSVLYNKQILLLKKFQVEKRELRLATRVQDVHYTGSKLKDIAFEVVDTEGDIDQTIHDDDKHGPPHTLRLQTGVTDNDSLRYIFKKGRCVVPSITLPKRQGNFFIEAFHPEHRELNVKFKVNIRQHQLECAFPSRSPDPKKTSEQFVESIFEEPASIPFENVASLSEIVMTENQPILAQTPEKHYDSNGKHEEIEDYLLRTPESKVTHVDPLTATSISKLMESELQELMDVEDDIRAIGTQIKDHENHLELLGSRKNELEDLVRIDSEELLQVQASVEPVPLSVSYDMSPKDAVVEKIENKVESAASLYSIVSRDASLRDQYCMFMSDVIGLVALIGTAPTPKISRSLAEYLGEDQMLAVVCQSNAVITTPEKYEDELISLASELGTCINGSHLFICLEDIRAFSGSFEEGSSQNRLALPVPVLPDGTSPRGFLGFAVNMIDIDAKHLQTKTSSGHGLRETLFYRLFGELQVYETKENMKHAYCSGCAKDGALSLDGWILRGNGIISLGFKELDVQFPVTSEQSQSVAISETIGDMENTAERKQKQIEDYRKELSLVEDGISYLSQQRSEKLQQFQERKGMYINLLEAKKMALATVFSGHSYKL